MVKNMTDELSRVRSFFQSIQVHVSNEWLESCISWCKNETLSANYTLEELQSKLYEQWLLFDLREAEVAVLPPNLPSQKHLVLNGNFCLQMIRVVDISKPKLWQLQRIRNTSTKGPQQDSDLVGNAKRMLQLTLTDGVQEVEAMEFKPISGFSINLVPGVKIRIKGPVVVRRGRLMLEPHHVKILGGEVEDLRVSHAAENVLARILKLPENPNPTLIEENLLITEERGSEGYKRLERPKSEVKSISKPVHTLTDEDLEAQEIETLMLDDRNFPPAEFEIKTPDLFQEDDFNSDFDQIASTSTATNRNPIMQRSKLPSFDGDDDIFNDIDIDAHLDKIENQNKSESVTTIAQLMKERSNAKTSFRIKARFKRVVEKLTVGEEEYKLAIEVEDETRAVVVKVHTDLISEFAGYDLEAMKKLKESVFRKEENAAEEVISAIKRVKDRLVNLDDVMVVDTAGEDTPILRICENFRGK